MLHGLDLDPVVSYIHEVVSVCFFTQNFVVIENDNE